MHSTIDETPEPKGRGGSITLIVLALVASLVAGGMLYWVTRDDDERKHLRRQATSLVESSPLGAVSRALTPPPTAVTNPATDPNTLSGRQIQGEMPRVEQPGTSAPAPENTPDTPIPGGRAPGSLASETPTPPEQAHTSPATPEDNTPRMAPPGDGSETNAVTTPDNPHQARAEGNEAATHASEPSIEASQRQTGPHHSGGVAAQPPSTAGQAQQQPLGVPYPGGVAPKVTEDSVVRGDFITDAAQ